MRQNEQKKSKNEQKRANPTGWVELEFNCYIVCRDWIRWFFVLGGSDPRGFSCDSKINRHHHFISIEDSATLRTKALFE